ncbi:aspartyl protease family protein [Flavobacterium sp.]|uniref:aspartyl protease family protein n=1 Tax=Flavobacterium sp. TaxID=239 RepID=UPI0026214CF5|nr:aspartyl protease family protein [Flavobacterium sp.]
MNKLYLFLLLTSFFTAFSQDGFQFPPNKNKVTVPFQLSNNLVLIPIEINGVTLNFLLDTGVEKTVLFSLEETDSLQFNNVEKIRIKGLGVGKSLDALYSRGNKVVINGLEDKNHEVYIILDQEVNFSAQLGIPVHGILGYHFFKHNFIEIDYKKKKLIIYKNKEVFSSKKLKQFDEIPISIELEKPYVEALVSLNDTEVNTKLLLDTGGSDAIWLFENKESIKLPKNNFDDFLGRGFSGNIYGKRSRIDKFKIGKHEVMSPTISFPDTLSLKNVNMVQGRNGSLGGEFFKRFDVIFDYANKKIYLKKNADFNEPFNYNMSGIEVQHNGLQWIKEEYQLKTRLVHEGLSFIDERPKEIKYDFILKPLYEVTNVRPNSPAAIAGIQIGDILAKVNGNHAFKYKLQEINNLMQSEDGKWIYLEVERKDKLLKFRFQLKKIL